MIHNLVNIVHLVLFYKRGWKGIGLRIYLKVGLHVRVKAYLGSSFSTHETGSADSEGGHVGP